MVKAGTIFIFCALVWGAPLYANDEPVRIKGRKTELRNKGVLAVYTDGVEVIRGKSSLNARRAAANEETSQVLADGDVRGRYFAENGDMVEFESASVRYDKNKSTGFLYGGIKATLKPAEDPENIYYLESDEIVVYEDKGVIEALKNVYLSGREMDVWAQKALYDSDKNLSLIHISEPTRPY